MSKRIESSGRVEGERGDLAEKMERYFMSTGSEKVGEEKGLYGGHNGYFTSPSPTKGRKSSEVKRGASSPYKHLSGGEVEGASGSTEGRGDT